MEDSTGKQIIDDWFDRIYPCLQNRNGTVARDILNDVRDTDKRTFNALYWRVDTWMRSFLARRPLTEEDERLYMTPSMIGLARLATFMVGRIQEGTWWGPADLPRLLSEIDGQEYGPAKMPEIETKTGGSADD